MGTDTLTDRQRQLYDFVRDRIVADRRAPTVREICRHFGFTGPAHVQKMLTKFEHLGLITRHPRQARAITLVGHAPRIPAELPTVPAASRIPLTKLQAEILGEIVAYLKENDIPPTLRYLMNRHGYRSLNAVNGLVKSLRRKGYLAPGNKTARCLLPTTPEGAT